MVMMQNLNEQLNRLPSDAGDEQIQTTADNLRSMKYCPVLLFDTPEFLTMRKADIRHEFERIERMSREDITDAGFDHGTDPDKVKQDHLNLLLYHYQLLCRLRNDEPEAWDEVNELYEDD